MDGIYSEIIMREMEGFRMARYTVISPAPEEDAMIHMERWAKDSGLLSIPGYQPRQIGWNFPYVPKELEEKFRLRGYVAAYIIPRDFVPACQGAELAEQMAGRYAVVTVKDPFADPFSRIGGAYERVFGYLKARSLELPSYQEGACFEFEEVCERDGVTYMDVWVPVKE